MHGGCRGPHARRRRSGAVACLRIAWTQLRACRRTAGNERTRSGEAVGQVGAGHHAFAHGFAAQEAHRRGDHARVVERCGCGPARACSAGASRARSARSARLPTMALRGPPRRARSAPAARCAARCAAPAVRSTVEAHARARSSANIRRHRCRADATSCRRSVRPQRADRRPARSAPRARASSPLRERERGCRAAERMADHRGGRTEVVADRKQVAGEVGQRGLRAGAPAVRGLVEGDDRIAGRRSGAHPRRDARAMAGPAMREQHVRLRVRIAPDIGGDGVRRRSSSASSRAPRSARPAHDDARSRRACRTSGRRAARSLRGEPAAEQRIPGAGRTARTMLRTIVLILASERVHGDTSVGWNQAVGEWSGDPALQARRRRGAAHVRSRTARPRGASASGMA